MTAEFNLDISRGRTPDGWWAYGYLVRTSEYECWIMEPCGEGIARRIVSGRTVSRCTGIHDTGEVPVFEGDIVRNEEDGRGRVYWDAAAACFFVEFEEYILDFCDLRDTEFYVDGNVWEGGAENA